jgi:hypothetical protein
MSPVFDKGDMDPDDTTSHTYAVVLFHLRGQFQQHYISKEWSKVLHMTIQVNRDRNPRISPAENVSHKNMFPEDDEPDNKVDTDLTISSIER